MNYLKRWRVITVFTICLVGSWYGLQNFLPASLLSQLPSVLPRESLSLGLDLQGGSSILLEVDLKDLMRDSMTSMLDDVRRTFRKEKYRYYGLLIDAQNNVRFKLHDATSVDEVASLLHPQLEAATLALSLKKEFRTAHNQKHAFRRCHSFSHRRLCKRATRNGCVASH